MKNKGGDDISIRKKVLKKKAVIKGFPLNCGLFLSQKYIITV